MGKFGSWIDRLFNEHKLVRRVMAVWAVLIVTFVTVMVMFNMDAVTEPVKDVALAVIGLIATVLGFYQWSRGRD